MWFPAQIWIVVRASIPPVRKCNPRCVKTVCILLFNWPALLLILGLVHMLLGCVFLNRKEYAQAQIIGNADDLVLQDSVACDMISLKQITAGCLTGQQMPSLILKKYWSKSRETMYEMTMIHGTDIFVEVLIYVD